MDSYSRDFTITDPITSGTTQAQVYVGEDGHTIMLKFGTFAFSAEVWIDRASAEALKSRLGAALAASDTDTAK